MERFTAYATYNEDGDLIGLIDDAPDDARVAYDEFIRVQKEASDNGVRI